MICNVPVALALPLGLLSTFKAAVKLSELKPAGMRGLFLQSPSLASIS